MWALTKPPSQRFWACIRIVQLGPTIKMTNLFSSVSGGFHLFPWNVNVSTDTDLSCAKCHCWCLCSAQLFQVACLLPPDWHESVQTCWCCQSAHSIPEAPVHTKKYLKRNNLTKKWRSVVSLRQNIDTDSHTLHEQKCFVNSDPQEWCYNHLRRHFCI